MNNTLYYTHNGSNRFQDVLAVSVTDGNSQVEIRIHMKIVRPDISPPKRDPEARLQVTLSEGISWT